MAYAVYVDEKDIVWLTDFGGKFRCIASTRQLKLPSTHLVADCFLKKLRGWEMTLFYHFVEVCW